jgi:MFS family permease
MGWVIGCPLLGWLSDKIGHRKPVLAGGIVLMMISFSLFIFLPDYLPPLVSMLLFGIASGAAMIPYTIIKEANPDNVKGSATGGINFLTFIITALIGPFFAAQFGKTLLTTKDHSSHFHFAGLFFLAVLTIALLASLIIKETGHGRKLNEV